MQVAAPSTGGTLSMLRRLASERGALRAGLSTAVAYNVVLNATRFATYDMLSSEQVGLSPFASGLGAGFLSGWLSSPLARARTILQMGSSSSATLHTLLVGKRAFSAAPSWALRNAGHTALIFSLFELGRQTLEEALPSAPRLLLHLAASANAAAVSCVLLNPIDLACSRVFYQSASSTAGDHATTGAVRGAAARYASPLDCARQVWRVEGVMGLYRGVGANLMRMVPHTTATFVLLHILKERGDVIAGLPRAQSDPTRGSAQSGSGSGRGVGLWTGSSWTPPLWLVDMGLGASQLLLRRRCCASVQDGLMG